MGAPSTSGRDRDRGRRPLRPLGGRALVVGLLATLLVAALAGCGLQADEQPEEIPQNALPRMLFEERRDSGAGVTAGDDQARIYVIAASGRNRRLLAVDVPVPPNPDPARAALQALIGWIPQGDAGLSTSIPHNITVRGLRKEGSVMNLDLANMSIEGPGQGLAIAQIVFTLTEFPNIYYVRFTIDGKAVSVPLGDRTANAGAVVSRRDFPALDPYNATTTTSPPTTRATTRTTTRTTARVSSTTLAAPESTTGTGPGEGGPGSTTP